MNDYFEDYIKASNRASQLTGILNGFIKYGWNISDDIKILMAKSLIDIYSKEEGEPYQKWIKEWEELIENLKAK